MTNALVSKLLFWAALLVVATNNNKLVMVHAQCTFSAPMALDDGLTLEQVKNSAAGTFTMRLTYTGGNAWIGIGINSEGSSKMVPATAVIGQMSPTGPSVLKYDMISDEKDASGVVPMASQTLTGATFVQDGMTSTLMFTQALSDYAGGVNDQSSWIYAVGLPNNEWAGKHEIHGSFYLPLIENCV